MRAIDHIVTQLQEHAMSGVYRGDADMPYAQHCTFDVALTGEKGVRFIFMRQTEEGRYAFTLSLSFRLYRSNKPSPFEHHFARNAVPVFFGSRVVDVLATPPQTKDGKHWKVWHYRLYTDADWKPLAYTPLLMPKDEPMLSWDSYSRALFVVEKT